jgi:hypothetical protein
MWRWLVREWNWPAAACFAAVFLLVLAPLFAALAGPALALVYLQLPAYMLHQWEEHSGDRFRLYVNRTVGRGREALTPAAAFWINSLGVWAVDLAALYLAWLVEPSAGLVAGYLAVVNAVPHLGAALLRREYNPGAVTAALLLLPIGSWCIVSVGSGAGVWAHAVALAVAAGLHALIIAYVVRRLSMLSAAEPGTSPATHDQA